MLAPINYLLENKSPMDSFFGGMQSVQGLQQNDNTLRQQELVNEAQTSAQARKAQMEAELDQLDTTDINAMRAFNVRYPDMAKGVQTAYDQLNAKQKENTLVNHSRIASLLRYGRPESAIDMLNSQVEAYRNSGDEKGAQETQSMADMIKMSPEAGLAALTWGLSIMSPKDVSDNMKGFTESTGVSRKEVDTGNQIQSYAIDPLTGNVSGAEWIADKAATPDNVLNNETSRFNTTQTNEVSEANNIRTNQASENNNIRTNTVSEGNNIRTNNQSNVNSERSALIQQFGITEQGRRADQQIEYNLQKQELANKQAKLQSFGGKVYMVYKDGTAAPAIDAQGNQITDTKVDPTIQRDIRNEKVRINKLNAILPEAEKLLQNATGSRTGAALDSGARLFGYSTEGAKTTAQLEVLSGQLVSMMPRMEGPQSDKDVAMYKQMAGNIADPTKTVAERQAALKTIRRMTQKAESDLAKSEKQAGQPAGASRTDAKRSSLFN